MENSLSYDITICVLGLGYIGLPTASLLATKGFSVRGVDVSSQIVDMINRGDIHIHEPDLDLLVKAAVGGGKLRASVTPSPADVFIISVPTPLKEEHVPDISHIEVATRSIAPLLKPGNLVILESTSPVGTTEKVGDWIRELRPDLKMPASARHGASAGFPEGRIYLAHCPERVLPGQIIRELVDNDRIIGGIDEESAELAGRLYRMFVQGRIVLTDCRTAEMCKVAENAFRDANIAFANELSLLCDRHDIDVWHLIELANLHPRVNILKPGPGVGGHCIAVDPWFLVHMAPDIARLIRTAREVNDSKPSHVIDMVVQKAQRYKDPVIACLGLSFKADVDDLRESPAVEIVKGLIERNTGRVLVVEPHIRELPPEIAVDGVVRLAEIGEALKQADIVVLLVDHRPFIELDRELLKGKVVVDTRGIWR